MTSASPSTAGNEAENATLVLRNVVARDASGPKGASRGMVYGVNAGFGRGTVAIVGAVEDGTVALAEAVVGMRSPDRGSIRIEGRDPAVTPALRARIGWVGLVASLPDVGTVGDAITIATSAWPSAPRPSEMLGRFGLGPLERRGVSALSPPELRAVEMAIALSVPDPVLLVVFEPFADIAIADAALVESELARVASRAPVVVLTSFPGDAKRFARTLILHKGSFVRGTDGAHADLSSSTATSLTVWVARGARELASALATSKPATAVSFDADATKEGAGVLRTSGVDGVELSIALADAVRASGAVVTAVAEGVPGLAEVRASTEFELRSRQLLAQRARALEAQARAPQGFGMAPGGAFGTPQPPPVGGAPFGAVGFSPAPPPADLSRPLEPGASAPAAPRPAAPEPEATAPEPPPPGDPNKGEPT